MNIKELAEQAGFEYSSQWTYWTGYEQELKRFAELVAKDAIKNAKAAKKAAKFQKLVKKMRAFQAEHYFTCYQPLYLRHMIEAFPDYKKKHVKRAYKETE